MILAKVEVTLKSGILDPQGKTVHHALSNLGINDISDVRIGKSVQMKFEGLSVEQARQQAEEACKKLLSNPVIEDYKIEMVEL